MSAAVAEISKAGQPSVKSNFSHTDEWTSVTESYPPIGRVVLVAYRPEGTENCSENHAKVEPAVFSYDYGRIVCRIWLTDIIYLGVTVWRDLPKLPPNF